MKDSYKNSYCKRLHSLKNGGISLKKFLSLIALGLLSVVLVACNSSDNSGKTSSNSGNDQGDTDQPKVTVVLKTLSSQYWKFVEAGAKQAFEDLGVNGTIVGPPAEDKVVDQINMIEDALSLGTDALVVSPSQPPTTVPVLEKFKKNNVPVIIIDTDVEWDDKETFIGAENYEVGQKGGEFLASILNEGDEVALLRGDLGNPTTDSRIQGAKDYLEEHGFVIGADQPANSDRSKGMSVIENILQNNPNIKAVYAANDDMALGALRAVQAKGLDIPVLGTGGTIEALNSIIEGGLAGTIDQVPYEMGYQGVVNALKAINGETVEKRIVTSVEIFHEENAKEKLAELEGLLK